MDYISSSEEEQEGANGGAGEVARTKRVLPRMNFSFESQDFQLMFRLPPGLVEIIIQRIGGQLDHGSARNNALSVKDQVLFCLEYLGRGGIYSQAQSSHGPHRSTLCRTLKRFVNAMNLTLLNEYVKWPTTIEGLQEIKQHFFAVKRMPNVIGLIDGTLIKIQGPKEYEEQFVDRHGSHSLNVMLVSGKNYTFYFVSANYPGSVHDARVLRQCSLYDKFETQEWRPPGSHNSILLGDSGFPVLAWLQTPINKQNVSAQEMRFNNAHKITRSAVERAIGLLKKKFLCLQLLRQKPSYAAQIVKCCVTLHNMCIDYNLPAYITAEDETFINDLGNEEDYNLNNLGLEDSDDDIPAAAQHAGKQKRAELVGCFPA